MHRFNKKKRKFPNDWTNLSHEQVLENIQYLIENLGKYDIAFYGDDRVLIDNIRIQKKEMVILSHRYNVYVINRRIFTVDGEIGRYISQLIYVCKHPSDEKTLMEKLEQFVKQHKLDIYFLLLAVCVAVACFEIFHINEKSKQKKEERQEQFEKIVNTKNNQIKTLNIVNIMNQKLRSL